MSTSHTQPEINNFELTPQEEIDCEDMVEPEYNYSDPNHKPPFKYVDYTEVKADDDNEINCLAFGKKGKYLCEITEITSETNFTDAKSSFFIFSYFSTFDSFIPMKVNSDLIFSLFRIAITS